MKKGNFNSFIFGILVLCSFAVYLLQLAVFHASRDTTFYFLQDLAFLPLQAAIVTIVLGKVLAETEKRDRLKKINMVINAFFTEAGTEIMMHMVRLTTDFADLKREFDFDIRWSSREFANVLRVYRNKQLNIQLNIEELKLIKALLIQKRTFLMRMLENPNLLEHDTFTDMLLAVFHVTEELLARNDLDTIPASDLEHLTKDLERAVRTLLIQWISHMGHLQADYPYLYSLETRRNPFQQHDVVVRQD